MQNNDDVLSMTQQNLLIPAFNQIVEILGKKGIKATAAGANDSRTISFTGKNGQECEYHCWISPMRRPRIYLKFKRNEIDHGHQENAFSGRFADEVNPEVLVKDFLSIFRFHT
jgi:hypothetical protein